MSLRNRYLRRQNTFQQPEVNLTPLIDVVFVVLIMFILIAPLLEIDQIELASASAIAKEENLAVTEASPITIAVNAQNKIFLNKQITNLAQLKKNLIELKQKYPKATPQLMHDLKGHFGIYQSVKNITEEVGFDKIDIVLKPA